jgi:hypothetical protein
MADKIAEKDYTKVNFTMVDDLTAEWTSTSAEFSGSIQKAVPDATFVLLEELGYSGGFPARFDEAMQGLVENVNSAIAAAKSYFDQLKQEDASLAGLFPDEPGADGDPKGGGGGGGGSQGEDNTAAQIEYLKVISLSDLKTVVDILTKYAAEQGLSLDELLSNVEYADAIKELLLSSPNLSEDYKKLIEEGTSEATLTALKSLMNGDLPEAIGLTQATQLTTKKYLTEFAKANNVSYEDLVGKEGNSHILKKALANMADVSTALGGMTEDNVQSTLKSIMDGTYSDNKLSNSAKVLIKSHMDALSELSGASIDEILSDESFKHDLYLSIENLDRFTAYNGGVSAMKNAGKVVSKLIV